MLFIEFRFKLRSWPGHIRELLFLTLEYAGLQPSGTRGIDLGNE
jgi:hypothetical protein